MRRVETRRVYAGVAADEFSVVFTQVRLEVKVSIIFKSKMMNDLVFYLSFSAKIQVVKKPLNFQLNFFKQFFC